MAPTEFLKMPQEADTQKDTNQSKMFFKKMVRMIKKKTYLCEYSKNLLEKKYRKIRNTFIQIKKTLRLKYSGVMDKNQNGCLNFKFANIVSKVWKRRQGGL